jgi:drug/metabolite transporter (DMT)-like permease
MIIVPTAQVWYGSARSSTFYELANQDRMPLTPFLPSLTAALAFGTMFPVAASALERVDAFHLTAIRYGLATLAFLGLLWAFEGRAALRAPSRARALELWALGTAGFAGFNLLVYLGLASSDPQHAAVFVALMPVMTVLAMAGINRIAPRPAIVAFSVAALAGAALVVSGGHPGALVSGGISGGDGLFLLGVASFVVYTIGARRFADFSPLRYTALSAAGGTVSILAVTEVVTLAGAEHTPSLADLGAVWWQLAYVVAIGAVVAVLAFNEGVRRLGPSNASLFGNLIPVVTLVIAVTLQSYHPAGLELAGIALTLAALVGANLAGRPQASARPVRAAWAATVSAKAGKSRA